MSVKSTFPCNIKYNYLLLAVKSISFIPHSQLFVVGDYIPGSVLGAGAHRSSQSLPIKGGKTCKPTKINLIIEKQEMYPFHYFWCLWYHDFVYVKHF